MIQIISVRAFIINKNLLFNKQFRFLLNLKTSFFSLMKLHVCFESSEIFFLNKSKDSTSMLTFLALLARYNKSSNKSSFQCITQTAIFNGICNKGQERLLSRVSVSNNYSQLVICRDYIQPMWWLFFHLRHFFRKRKRNLFLEHLLGFRLQNNKQTQTQHRITGNFKQKIAKFCLL